MRSKIRKPSLNLERIARKPYLSRSGTAFAFVACLGIWLPKAQAATLVNLDATQLPTGALTNWTNTGSVTGNFTVPQGAAVPAVATVDGVKGVALAGGGAGGTHYIGPVPPAAITGAGARTVEAWVHNPAVGGEEVVFAWGARNTPGPTGPVGENFSFGHGSDGGDAAGAGFGAVAMWGAPDIGWSNDEVAGRWTYIVATYDGTTTVVYVDGVEVNREDILINTIVSDTTGNPLRFRVGRQNSPAGGLDNTGAPSLTVAKIKVQDTAIDAAAVLANFNAEKGAFNLNDTDGDGMPDWYEARHGLQISVNDATADLDNDGLANLAEFQANTTPGVADTDGDGLSDGAEVNRTAGGQPAPTNPLNADSDNDGLRDGAETGTGTFVDTNNTGSNPLSADSDADTFGDGKEVFSSTNPNLATSTPAVSLLIDLDATVLSLGNLTVWTNKGAWSGNFTNSGTIPVQSLQAVKGATLNGPAASGPFFNGPPVPAWMTGNGNRTVEAWILNPAAADEETIFAWGRRGGPDGSNSSFNHGLNASFGAVGHWGGNYDIDWGGADNVKQGQWTFVVYTYDGATQTATVYSDGAEAKTETLPTVLNTFRFDTANVPLRFRIGTQTDAGGGATGALRGSMTIGQLKVYDGALDATTIQNHYTAGADQFGVIDFDNDGLPTWYERQYSFLNERNAADANADQDSDGLNNLGEFTARSSPDNADTDGDGLTDGVEVNTRATSPIDPDTDRDGLSDKAETGTNTFVSGQDTGTNPLNADSDLDGSFDSVEVAFGSNPNVVGSTPNRATPTPLVNLDATGLALGTLNVWTNSNALGWPFNASTNAAPVVELVGGVKGVSFGGTNYYTGPGAPVNLTGNTSRSVEAWIFNPAVAGEEAVFAWGRRGGPDGSNASFNHGTDAAFGAIGHWGAPDIGWGGASNVVAGRWTFLSYTYDFNAMLTTVYKDGVRVNSETNTIPLATHATNNTTAGQALPFRIAYQNAADGTPATPSGTLTIGKIRVYDQVLTPQQITSRYDAEKAQFTPAAALQILTSGINTQTGAFTLTWTAVAGQTYSVESSTNLTSIAWQTIANNLTVGTFTDTTAASAIPFKFYRLRVP